MVLSKPVLFRKRSIIIDDIVGNRRGASLIKRIMEQQKGEHSPYLVKPPVRVISAKRLNNKILKSLSKRVAKYGKYDAIFKFTTGGSKIFNSLELKGFTDNVITVPMSSHNLSPVWRARRRDEMLYFVTRGMHDMFSENMRSALEKVDKKDPRILILDSDAGAIGRSSKKLSLARDICESRGAKVDIAIGVAASEMLKANPHVIDLVGFKSPKDVLRASEICALHDPEAGKEMSELASHLKKQR